MNRADPATEALAFHIATMISQTEATYRAVANKLGILFSEQAWHLAKGWVVGCMVGSTIALAQQKKLGKIPMDFAEVNSEQAALLAKQYLEDPEFAKKVEMLTQLAVTAGLIEIKKPEES